MNPSVVSSRPLKELVEDGLDLPTHFPPVRRVVAGTDGTIWLERFGSGRPGLWLVLSEKGEPMFQVQLPPALEVQQASVSSIWATQRYSLDIPCLIRLDVSAIARGKCATGG